MVAKEGRQGNGEAPLQLTLDSFSQLALFPMKVGYRQESLLDSRLSHVQPACRLSLVPLCRLSPVLQTFKEEPTLMGNRAFEK